jgi:dTDP-4-dehydrorhamnose 3,5-epimerase
MGGPVCCCDAKTSGAVLIFTPLILSGAFAVDIEPMTDKRGYFARTWCQDEARGRGIHVRFVQSSVSYNKMRGTLRGLHFQRPPCGEAKLVRCLRGTLFDVLVDLRRDSPTFGRWVSVDLTGENARAVLVPKGVAHGFVTLSDNTFVSYDISEPYRSDMQAGIRWNDPDVSIRWPLAPIVIGKRDARLPFLAEIGDL